MTTPTSPAAPDAVSAEPIETEATVETPKKPVIPAFTFPFKPAEFAKNKASSKGQTHYKKGEGHGHTKTPGAAPPGTRRSMGKR
ncbi:hypothetical protein NTD86_02540 [Pseudomonas sp. 7P_10.2_Bac1]|uniref:hypothetical protein n=1 Tax=Pseudomonas sp. 7P_10.2_Bac1 TaxID=2971614 RepID=UPI0021C9858F|nr:hypothetical protein [Pseudomonas sp. 7P_10.2_Bac1]MCU1725867.1 hypothetical protein [Pseudomonas sp. 7P_10.2_Bac1]